VNKLGIRDRVLLEDTERAITRRRARQGFPRSATFRTYDGFRAIHRHLFRDLYSWAGKERRFTTGRGQIPFAIPEHIGPWMRQLFHALDHDNYLIGLDLDAFAVAAAKHVNEINAGHPFIDGNGRTQRFWLRMLADHAGFDLTLRAKDATRWNEASRLGFMRSDHKAMAALLNDRLRPNA
jgi:cell filamentation protein